MPNKHFYFAIGAAHGTLISYFIYQGRHWLTKKYRFVRKLYRLDRDWFLYFPFFIGLAGLLALTPDLLHLFKILPKETTREGIFNVFFFHSYFEWLEDASVSANWTMNFIGSIFLFALSIGVLLFYVRTIKSILNKTSKPPSNSQ